MKCNLKKLRKQARKHAANSNDNIVSLSNPAFQNELARSGTQGISHTVTEDVPESSQYKPTNETSANAAICYTETAIDEALKPMPTLEYRVGIEQKFLAQSCPEDIYRRYTSLEVIWNFQQREFSSRTNCRISGMPLGLDLAQLEAFKRL